jgi:hypothetical protein
MAPQSRKGKEPGCRHNYSDKLGGPRTVVDDDKKCITPAFNPEISGFVWTWDQKVTCIRR